MSGASGKLLQWRLRLSKLEFGIVHQDGINYQNIDALSKQPTDRTDKTNLDNDISVSAIITNTTSRYEKKREKEVRRATRNRPDRNSICNFLNCTHWLNNYLKPKPTYRTFSNSLKRNKLTRTVIKLLQAQDTDLNRNLLHEKNITAHLSSR